MTLNQARQHARRLAGTTRHPALLFRSPGGGWDVWHTLEAAKWLANDGELVLPPTLGRPDQIERELRTRAMELQGHARIVLLEAAMAVRGQLALARRPELDPEGRQPEPAGTVLRGP